jgi:hypothetical protein
MHQRRYPGDNQFRQNCPGKWQATCRRSSRWTRECSKIADPAGAHGGVYGAVSLDRTISDATRGSSRVMFDYREHCGAGPGVRARAPRGTQPSTPIARAGQSRLPLEACNPYSGSTPPEAYSRPDRTWEQPLRAAAVQGWRAAPPEGLVLDWREHDGSIGRLGA